MMLHSRRLLPVAILISIVLHVLVLLIAQPKKILVLNEQTSKRSATKDVPIKIKLLPPKDLHQENKTAQIQGNGKGYRVINKTICAGQNEQFRGIGIKVSFGSEIIIEAPEQYPAYKAGLRLNDVVLSMSDKDDTADFEQITVQRSGQVLNFKILKDTVCYKKD
jgi:hypothetical protein